MGHTSDDEVFRHLSTVHDPMTGHPSKPTVVSTPDGATSQEGASVVEGDPLHLPGEMAPKDLKPSLSSEDDKPEDDDLLSKWHCLVALTLASMSAKFTLYF